MPEATERQHWLLQNRDVAVRLLLLAVVIAFVLVGVILWLTGGFELKSVGYAGVWLLSFLGAASIVVPVPGLAAVCVAAAPAFGLNPVIIGVLAGSAEALGETTGYVAGLSGRSFVQRHRWFPSVDRLVRRHGAVIVFCMSVIPNPLFDLVGIAAGSIGYPLRKFLVIVFVAKSIKSTGVAYACYLSVDWIQRLINAGG